MKLDLQRIFAFRLGVRTLLLVPFLIAALVEDSHGADCLRVTERSRFRMGLRE